MRTCPVILLVVSLWLCTFNIRAEEASTFEGTCHNVTGNADGILKILFMDDGSRISGFMCVSGWLTGGGNLSGTHQGSDFRFKTTDLNGTVIDWQGAFKNGKLSGEYFIPAGAGLPRQVGEWSANLVGSLKPGGAIDGKVTTTLLKMILETRLNESVKQSDGKVISGAENLFKTIHPVGTGVSICVDSVDVEWKSDSQGRGLEDIHKFKADYILYWQGLIKPTGWTRLRLAYNAKIDAVTSHEIIESTGTTNQQAGDMAFDIGVILGAAAMEKMMNSK